MAVLQGPGGHQVSGSKKATFAADRVETPLPSTSCGSSEAFRFVAKGGGCRRCRPGEAETSSVLDEGAGHRGHSNACAAWETVEQSCRATEIPCGGRCESIRLMGIGAGSGGDRSETARAPAAWRSPLRGGHYGGAKPVAARPSRQGQSSFCRAEYQRMDALRRTQGQ